MDTQRQHHIADAPDGPLVSTDWLHANLDAPNLRIIDVRGEFGGQPPHKRADYARAHLPGAVFADWTTDFVDRTDPVPYQLADPDRFRADAEALGIGDDDLVVTYDDYCDVFAARLWWAFRAYGHDAVRVLDGGWRSWLAEGRPTTTAVPVPPASTFTPRAVPRLRLDLADLLAARDRGVTLLDARPRHHHDGRHDSPRTGHIPGAVNVPYPELVDESTGRVRSLPALRAVFTAAGVDPDEHREIVSSCGGGISATVACLALDLLGRPGVPVYDGSFAEWVADPRRPVAQTPPVAAH